MLPRLQAASGLTREEAFVLEMMENALKLLRDGTSLGDIKLMGGAMRELRYAFKVFAPYRGVRKVSRLRLGAHPAEDAPSTAPRTSSRAASADSGFMIITGAGGGIMRAYQEGAGRERSFGVNIRLPFEQAPNEFIRDDPKLVTFHYFFTRKLIFIKEADAVVLLPGRLRHARRGLRVADAGPDREEQADADRLPGRAARHLLEDLAALRRRPPAAPRPDLAGGPEPLQGPRPRSTRRSPRSRPSTACTTRRGTSGERFVIRLHRPLAPALVTALNREFGDIVVSGTIEQGGALEEEREQEPDLAALPRLVLHFNRTQFRAAPAADRPDQPGWLRGARAGAMAPVS